MHSKHPAFTLTEILIALTVLGVLCAIAIPKLLYPAGNAHSAATFKEVIYILDTLLDQGFSTGDLETDGSNVEDYFMATIKGLKKCRVDSEAQFCWTSPPSGTIPLEDTQPGLILANGAVVVGFDNAGTPQNNVLVDYNGSTGPNTLGIDQLWLAMCVSDTACTGPPAQDAGTVTAVDSSATNVQLFQTVMLNQ